MLDYTTLKSEIDSLILEKKYEDCIVLIQNNLHEFDDENKANLLIALISCYEQLNNIKNAAQNKIWLSHIYKARKK